MKGNQGSYMNRFQKKNATFNTPKKDVDKPEPQLSTSVRDSVEVAKDHLKAKPEDEKVWEHMILY